MDQIPFPKNQTVDGIAEVTGDLAHPQSVRLLRDAGDLHTSGREIDEEERQETLQSSTRPYFDSEEIRRHQQFP